MSEDSKIIHRPDAGTVIDQIDRAVISARKISKARSVRQTESHHAFEITCKGNVVVKIERGYYNGSSTLMTDNRSGFR